METTDVERYVHPNEEFRSYLTSEDISSPCVEAFERPLENDPGRLAATLGTIGAQTVRELLDVPGVVKLRIKPKEVRVQKAPDASWDDMEPEILRIMNRAVRKSRLHVLKP